MRSLKKDGLQRKADEKYEFGMEQTGGRRVVKMEQSELRPVVDGLGVRYQQSFRIEKNR